MLVLWYCLCLLGRICQAIPSVPTGMPGVNMPLIGLGTGGHWVRNSSAVYEGTKLALGLGYRHLDTAYGYGTLRDLGKAIAESGIHRDELFITSKVPGGLDGPATTAVVKESLEALGLPSVDLMLIHFPAAWNGTGGENRVAAWRALERAVSAGQARAIGVSHFCPRHLEEILAVATVPVAVNQAEYHVGMFGTGVNKTDGIAFDTAHNVTYESFMPLCGQCRDPELITGPVTNGIGHKYGKTGAQVALRWLVQQGIPVIPRSGNKQHQLDNMDIFDFELSTEDMKSLDKFSNSKLSGSGGDCDVA